MSPEASASTRKESQSVMQATVRTLMDEIEADPTRRLRLSDLARRAGYSVAHLQRSFSAIAGSSPKAFQTAARMRLFKRSLRGESSVTCAITDSGFSSSSRLYEKSDTELGMTPTDYKKGGAGVTIAWTTGETSLGQIMIGATRRGICFLQFGRSERALLAELRREYPAARLQPMPASSVPEFRRWMVALNAYLEGARAAPGLPLDVGGTAFQLRVWRYLRGIPRGSVQTYSNVAAGIGHPAAARAVARACASNPVALLIPCHRVVRGSGAMSGYRWGVGRKRALLKMERISAAGR